MTQRPSGLELVAPQAADASADGGASAQPAGAPRGAASATRRVVRGAGGGARAEARRPRWVSRRSPRWRCASKDKAVCYRRLFECLDPALRDRRSPKI